MTAVHCPRCGCTDWRSEQEYHLDLFMWGYSCAKCGNWVSEVHYQGLAKNESMMQQKSVRFDRLDRVAQLFDGEDSQ